MNKAERVQLGEEFRRLAKPLNAWLQENYHPHTQIIINFDSAVVAEGDMAEHFDIADSLPKEWGFSVCKKLNALQEEQHIFTDDEWLWLSSELGGMPTCEEELPPQND